MPITVESMDTTDESREVTNENQPTTNESERTSIESEPTIIRKPSSPIERLPNEILDQILRIVADSTRTPRERKQLFRAYRRHEPLFSKLWATREALFGELDVFTTPASMNRLIPISNNDLLKGVVYKMIFHRPTLGFHEEIWDNAGIRATPKRDFQNCIRRISGTEGPIAGTQNPREYCGPQNRSRALKAYCQAYLYETLGMNSGSFVKHWASAMSRLSGLRAIGITGNDNEDQLMSLEQQDMPRFGFDLSGEYRKAAAIRIGSGQQMMARLYPEILIPYIWADTDALFVATDQYKQSCMHLLSSALEASIRANTRVQHLSVTVKAGLSLQSDLSNVASGMRNLKTAEIGVVDWNPDYDLLVDKIVSSAPQLRGLRLYGNDAHHSELHKDLDFGGLGRYQGSSLSVLELLNLNVSTEKICSVLSRYDELRYLRFQGGFSAWGLGIQEMRDVFLAMKLHPSLDSFDMLVWNNSVHLTTYEDGCENCWSSLGCRACRDTARIKHDVVTRIPCVPNERDEEYANPHANAFDDSEGSNRDATGEITGQVGCAVIGKDFGCDLDGSAMPQFATHTTREQRWSETIKRSFKKMSTPALEWYGVDEWTDDDLMIDEKRYAHWEAYGKFDTYRGDDENRLHPWELLEKPDFYQVALRDAPY